MELNKIVTKREKGLVLSIATFKWTQLYTWRFKDYNQVTT